MSQKTMASFSERDLKLEGIRDFSNPLNSLLHRD